MQWKSSQARDPRKILVQSEHAGAMLQRNRGNEHIRSCKAYALGPPHPENRCRLSVGPEASGLQQFPLRKIVSDAVGISRETLKDFGNHHPLHRKRLAVVNHPPQFISGPSLLPPHQFHPPPPTPPN